MSDDRTLLIVLAIAFVCLVWGSAKAWPHVPVWLVASGVTVALALAIVGGVL